jgi:hypothetical protein
MSFDIFIGGKTQFAKEGGFDALFVPDYLKDFQKSLVQWSVLNARCGLFEDCGLGKTVQQLVWAQNIAMKTNGRVMVLTPLSISEQTVEEAEKFGIEAERARDGVLPDCKIVITNYEQLHKYDSKDFVGCVCDESSILKNVKGKTKMEVTAFMRKMSYRLLCTATASPNDYMELGTSSEALGHFGYMDMLKKFFKSDDGSMAIGGSGGKARGGSRSFGGKMRFKGHSQEEFWRWVCSWARAIRKPSDLGYDDTGYDLPELRENLHLVKSETVADGFLFALPAVGLLEQRQARTRTINERCELAAKLVVDRGTTSVSWVSTNAESRLVTEMIPGSVELTGSELDEVKEEKLKAFRRGEIKALVTKPKLAGFGHNWQHCNHQTVFPSHSFEQYYQCVRRSWRFGQTSSVDIDVVSTQADEAVLKNLQRKTKLSEEGFDRMVDLMSDFMNHERNDYNPSVKAIIPSWLT